MKLLVTGGCGYVGTVLVPTLLSDGHEVTVYDTQWFGNYLQPHSRLNVVLGDVRDIGSIPLHGCEAILHLANIANDPAVELNQTLSWEVNVLATQQLADKALRVGTVRQFIYASSGSVYGVSDEPEVTEELALLPITAYNKTKMVAERVLLSYKDTMQVHCVRPATVCGYSPRMRLDVSVNMLTMQAITKKLITVYGGEQTRPNINIHDMIRVYQHFLANQTIESGCYNAGFENISILDIARRVAERVPAEILVSSSNDPRSYRQNSDKLLATGFKQLYSVSDAIEEVINKFNSGFLKDEERYYTVRTMKKLGI